MFTKPLSLGKILFTPWSDPQEFREVYHGLYSFNHCASQHAAIQRIETWRTRFGRLPQAIETTSALVHYHLARGLEEYPTAPSVASFNESVLESPPSSTSLTLQTMQGEISSRFELAMIIIRFVNGLTDANQVKGHAMSVNRLASQIGIPRLFVDIRHEATHNDLPALSVLRIAGIKALTYLSKRFWEPQLASHASRASSITHYFRDFFISLSRSSLQSGWSPFCPHYSDDQLEALTSSTQDGLSSLPPPSLSTHQPFSSSTSSSSAHSTRSIRLSLGHAILQLHPTYSAIPTLVRILCSLPPDVVTPLVSLAASIADVPVPTSTSISTSAHSSTSTSTSSSSSSSSSPPPVIQLSAPPTSSTASVIEHHFHTVLLPLLFSSEYLLSPLPHPLSSSSSLHSNPLPTQPSFTSQLPPSLPLSLVSSIAAHRLSRLHPLLLFLSALWPRITLPLIITYLGRLLQQHVSTVSTTKVTTTSVTPSATLSSQLPHLIACYLAQLLSLATPSTTSSPLPLTSSISSSPFIIALTSSPITSPVLHLPRLPCAYIDWELLWTTLHPSSLSLLDQSLLSISTPHSQSPFTTIFTTFKHASQHTSTPHPLPCLPSTSPPAQHIDHGSDGSTSDGNSDKNTSLCPDREQIITTTHSPFDPFVCLCPELGHVPRIWTTTIQEGGRGGEAVQGDGKMEVELPPTHSAGHNKGEEQRTSCDVYEWVESIWNDKELINGSRQGQGGEGEEGGVLEQVEQGEPTLTQRECVLMGMMNTGGSSSSSGGGNGGANSGNDNVDNSNNGDGFSQGNLPSHIPHSQRNGGRKQRNTRDTMKKRKGVSNDGEEDENDKQRQGRMNEEQGSDSVEGIGNGIKGQGGEERAGGDVKGSVNLRPVKKPRLSEPDETQGYMASVHPSDQQGSNMGEETVGSTPALFGDTFVLETF